ncbi:MAG: cellulose-binding protein [Chlorogloea purpurea SAG 13.99]|nr:cellulose-binding protein [Chlorogloea purpurea SAG 13.99]
MVQLKNVKNTQKINIGTNLTGIADYSPQLPFIDSFKSSRAWVWKGQEGPYLPITTNLDRSGWLASAKPPDGVAPEAVSMTFLFTGLKNKYPGGQYLVLYEGQGEMKYKLAATKNKSLSKPGRDVIDINAAKGNVVLQITSTDPKNTGDYIRNIRIIPAVAEKTATDLYKEKKINLSAAKIFNPDFQSVIEPFKTLRFMDWMRTNGSNQVKWSDRPTVTQAQWTTKKGVPVEIMVALANQQNASPWFTMPHMADDDYVRNFAQYVKNNLAPGKKIYVEYTNEAWNFGFTQSRWINERAKEAGMKNVEWYARRSAQVINIWKAVFGEQSHRIVGVLGAQAGNLDTASSGMAYLKKTGNAGAIDAIAIAPYFGGYLGRPEYASQVQTLSVDDLFRELTTGGVVMKPEGGQATPGGALQQAYRNMQNYVNFTSKNNLQLVAYEGGQHLVGVRGVQNNKAITSLFIAANRDERMGKLYEQYLNKWNQLGGGLFVNFSDVITPTKWGSWGILEDLKDVNNPKYKAVMRVKGQKE